MAPKREAPTNGASGEDTLGSMPLITLADGRKGFVTGCRIPKAYFCTSGFGETDSGGGVDPWETGSYDLALEAAGICDFNVMKYTSVMPPESHEVNQNEARLHYVHGAVTEAIMSQINGVQGDRLSVGVARCQVTRKSDGKSIGGYAAEYEGHATEADVKKILTQDLTEIFERRFSHDEYEMTPPSFTVLVGEVTKAFGTALAAICFVSYINPIIVEGELARESVRLDEEGAKHADASSDKKQKKKARK